MRQCAPNTAAAGLCDVKQSRHLWGGQSCVTVRTSATRFNTSQPANQPAQPTQRLIRKEALIFHMYSREIKAFPSLTVSWIRAAHYTISALILQCVHS